MSFKGIGKAISRAPQQFRVKMNKGYLTNDPVYEDAERRFKELETETKKLSEESKRYSAAVNGMLNHQIGFSKAVEEIYKPISGKMSDPNASIPEDNPEGIEASVAYREIVAELQRTLKPDLSLIEEKVVKPSQELLKIVDGIRKMLTKRNHKQLDLDRHMNTLQKYENKKEPTAKDEEKLYKAQAEVEIAQQEFDYYNDMLKTQLPVLFELQNEFLKPMFVSFYYMQLNIFYTLYNQFQDMKIPYFDLEGDIVETFTAKRGNIEEQTDSLSITHFKLGYSKSKLEMTRRRFGKDADGSPVGSDPSSPTYPGAPGYGAAGFGAGVGAGVGAAGAYGATAGYGAAGAGYGASEAGYGGAAPAYSAAPAYGAGVGAGVGAAAAAGYGAANSANTTMYGSTAPSYTPPTTAPSAAETVTALYDYTAQAEGDLTFQAGSVIEVVERTQDTNGWWTGRLNGVVGVFPANYVQINKN